MLNERRAFIAFAPLLLLLLACVQTTRAQLCPGSQVYLIVRDEQGRVIDPAPLSTRNRSTRTFDFVRVETIDLPDGFPGEARGVKSLKYSDDGCTLRSVEETTFELGGKRMRLVFRNAKRLKDRSTFYTIDLPPFGQGTFEIDLSNQTGLLSDPTELTSTRGGGSLIFSAAAWRKASDTAPAFPRSHLISLRGTVTNGATRTPVSGVKVELLLGASGEEPYAMKGVTDAEGQFEIAGVPDETIIAAGRVSVSVQPEGFARTQVFIDNHRTLAQSQEVLENINIEVRPLVTLRGHLLDTTTERPPSITPGTLEATALVNEWLTSGNYRANIYHSTKAEIHADSTFTLRVAVGKNTFSLADYQKYQRVAPGTQQELIDQFLQLDIKADNQPEIVFRVRRAGP